MGYKKRPTLKDDAVPTLFALISYTREQSVKLHEKEEEELNQVAIKHETLVRATNKLTSIFFYHCGSDDMY